jgi:putative methyltransferase
MRVKFCSHGYAWQKSSRQLVGINPAWLYIQKWYELHGKNPNVVWLFPGILKLDTLDVIIQNIIQEKPDVLGLGIYIWNFEIQFSIAKQIKNLLPNTVIVCGGPQLSVHQETEKNNQTNFFVEHPYVDYVVYGDGEKPFQQIIDYHSGFLPDKSEFVNIIENVQGQRKIYPYEVLSDERYLSESPYVSQEAHMFEVRDYLVSRGIPNREQNWAIEFARGCMYSCSFCDWSQNLTKKVKRRTHDWKQDIDLFCRLDVPIRETDANFGQWSDDIKAYDYALSLYDPSRNFSFRVENTSKLKKDVTEYIVLKNILVYDDSYPKISLQDIDTAVLSAINRPSVSWETFVKMIVNLKNKLPPEKFKRIVIETILGLPEQTIDGIIDAYAKLFELGVVNCSYYLWHMLDNSPAADANYQKLWGLQIKEVHYIADGTTEYLPDLEQTYKKLAEGDTNIDIFLKKPIVVGHRKMTMVDMWAVSMIQRKWHTLNQQENLLEKYNATQAKNILINLLLESLKEADEQYNIHGKYMDKYGIIIWGHYDPVKKTLYSDF